MESGKFDREQPRAAHLVRPYLGRAWMENLASEQVPAMTTARPFLQTSGRVVSDTDLPVETQIVSTAQGLARRHTLPFESGDIVGLCTQPMAVAEVAARLRLHLGVVRVLVTDLSADGDLSVYQPPVDASRDVDLLLRVRHGLRALS